MTPRTAERRACLLAGLLLIAGCASAPAPAPPSSPSSLLGGPLPTFARTDLDGRTFDSGATRGRIVVVEFFAAYCRPCQQTLPALRELARRRPEVVVVAVSLDDSEKTARAQQRRHGLAMPVLLDGDHSLAGRFRITELPASFVIDAQGQVVWAGGPGHPPDAPARVVTALLGR